MSNEYYFVFHVTSICSEDTQLEDSTKAQREVNMAMLRYFDACQLVVSRSATLLAFIFPHLRGIILYCICIHVT